MKNHNDIEQKLTDYHFGELSPDEEQAVREHLTICPECQQSLGQLTSVVKTLKHDLVDDDVQIKLLSKEQRKQIFAAASADNAKNSDHADQEDQAAEQKQESHSEASKPGFPMLIWFRNHRKTILSTAAGLMIASLIWLLVLPQTFRQALLSKAPAVDQTEIRTSGKTQGVPPERQLPPPQGENLSKDGEPPGDFSYETNQVESSEASNRLSEIQSSRSQGNPYAKAKKKNQFPEGVRDVNINSPEPSTEIGDFSNKKGLPAKNEPMDMIQRNSRYREEITKATEFKQPGQSFPKSAEPQSRQNLEIREDDGLTSSRQSRSSSQLKAVPDKLKSGTRRSPLSADPAKAPKPLPPLEYRTSKTALKQENRITEQNEITSTGSFFGDKLTEKERGKKHERKGMSDDGPMEDLLDAPNGYQMSTTPKDITPKPIIVGEESIALERLDTNRLAADIDGNSDPKADLSVPENGFAAFVQTESIRKALKETHHDDRSKVVLEEVDDSDRQAKASSEQEELTVSGSVTLGLDTIAQLDEGKDSSDKDVLLPSSAPTDSERFPLSDELLNALKVKQLESQGDIKNSFGKLGVEFGDRSKYLLDEDARQLVIINPDDKENQDVSNVLHRLQSQIETNKAALGLSLPPMVQAVVDPVSTFSIDVDTASYTAARKDIFNGNRPDPLSIRQEEFINYFDYKYQTPKHTTFAIYTDYSPSPFHKNKFILRIAIQGKRPGSDTRRPSAFTLVVDTSGSMAEPNRLPMVQRQLPQLLGQMRPQDRISVVSTDVKPRLVLDQVSIADKETIIQTVNRLRAKGGTNLEEGLITAYDHTERNYVGGAYNRVVLFSDGVANLGEINAENINKRVEDARKLGITFTAVGVGRGLYNDELLETLANKGDGNYIFVDNDNEAKRAFVDNFAANFNVIARDVKIQVEFNPKKVISYRLMGYDNRRLKKEDFRNDDVDAGEVGAGQSVTALYEVELAEGVSDELCEVRVRYKDPDTYKAHEFNRSCGIDTNYNQFSDADWSFRLASITSEFAEYLRYGSAAKGISPDDMLKELRPLVHELNADPTVTELQHLIMQVK